MSVRHIEIETVGEFGDKCDGCGYILKSGDKYLGGIDSCCWDSVRRLCAECIKWAYEALMREEKKGLRA